MYNIKLIRKFYKLWSQ